MKKQMKQLSRLLSLTLAAVIILGLTACGGNGTQQPSGSGSGAPANDSKVYTITLAGTVPDDHPISQAMYKFEQLAEELSGGQLNVEVHTNNTLGGSREILEAVQAGELQMCECSQSMYTSFTDELVSAGLPFLFDNREAAYAFFDSEIGDQMTEAVSAQTGVRILGYFENGIRQLTNSKHPVTSPEDMKGLKIRVMESPLYIDMFTRMGANPMPMSFSELYTALQQKTVDGQDNPYAITATNAFYEVQAYMTDLSHTFDVTCFSINDAFYQSLPADLQAVIDQAAAEATVLERQLSIDLEAEYMQTIENGGCQITHLTDDQRGVFREATGGTYDYFRENYNPTVTLDTVLAKAEEVNAAN